MWEDIKAQIEKGDHMQARNLIDGKKPALECYDDTFAILDASVYQAEGNAQGMFDAISRGLLYNPENYELYYMLGCFYYDSNPDQAFLCFQNALFYCDTAEDHDAIEAEIAALKQAFEIKVKNTVIVIASYNSCYLQQKNIESIRNTLLKGTYEIVVVDNASNDGVTEWLEEQKDITLIKNAENRGFSCACNQGVKATENTESEDYDVFLLNNDTRLAVNSLFWLRMGLYENEKTGATGSFSNYAGNDQVHDVVFQLPNDYLKYGAQINIPMAHPYEERPRLSGFAMLVKRNVWNSIGGMDERFAPGYFEDDDLCMQILKHGYRILLCRNSFIYHAGSQSFAHKENLEDILLGHHQLFIEKHGFDILEYAMPDRKMIGQIPFDRDDEFNILQIGSGIGAELKMLRTEYPNAHAVGVETDKSMFGVSCCTDVVFNNLKEIYDIFKRPVFDVLMIKPEAFAGISDDDKNIIVQLCKKDCVVLPKNAPYAGFPFDKIKLVIWDMDDTFWNGTLSEGEVTLVNENTELIKKLSDCGIINSISSKNDEEEVLKVLKRQQLEENFVFNDINWNNKGEQIRRKLISMGLRAENVLFIDDNIRNLEEAKYINNGIMTALPDIIPALADYVDKLPKSDMAHKRLARYKILEKKAAAENYYDSKEAFLYDSDIKVIIRNDCINELDRIEELVSRTNQLNYTKVRSSRDELLRLVSSDWMDCGYVHVWDKFGDYGIVGFYCVNRQEHKVEHFLFSCRILGMRVEQYVYGKIGYPEFEPVQPVVGMLEKNVCIPWISEGMHDDYEAHTACDNRVKILIKGPCDMSAIESYLIGGKITTEFNYVNEEGFITTGQNHSMNIWESAVCSEEEIDDILAEVPFITKGDFETMIFKKEYHVICYSLLPDCHAGLYRSKRTGRYITFGSDNFDLTDESNMAGYIDGTITNHGFLFNEQIIREFSKNWEFVGNTSEEDLLRNLQYIYDNAPGNPVFILLLGSEIEYEGGNAEFANHAGHHKKINRLVNSFAADKERVKIINMTDFIKSQDDYEDCINHFSRNVYYDLAAAVVSCINGLFSK